MIARLLDEPEMQFGRGAHVDPRFGLLDFGPADQAAEAAPATIPIGVVGTQETIEGVLRWLRRCRKPINPPAAKRSSNFFPPFPGFTAEVGLESELTFDSRLQRSVPAREIRKLAEHSTRDARLEAAVELLLEEITAIGDHGLARAILVCPPLDLLQLIKTDETTENDGEEDREGTNLGPSQLHDVLKATAMRIGVPLQFVLPATYDASLASKQTTATGRPRTQQDEATKAWNLHTALYYKAGGFPWSLVRDPHALDSCFIGISFYFDNAGNLATSSAQVFDERGEGIIVRGGQAKLTKGDRRPYLEAADAESLLLDALKRYRSEHHNLPARVVIHKSSRFRAEEIEGLQRAADAERITDLELVAIGDSRTRVSARKHAPLRGTHIVLDGRHQVLYTSGSVPFYEFYPGPYVPQPLGITLQQSEQSAEQHAREILALTKLNWNNSRLDGREPITMRAARSIGTILRHVDDDGIVGARYAFYM
ncbi:MAG: argonaute/piwi family protein [Solirubrobacteraceae bacterium]